MAPTPRTARRAVLSSGIAWTAFGEVAQLLLNLGGMLLLVRIIPPAEYGKAGAATSLLVLLNAFSSPSVLAHTLQLADGEEPDWTLHWHAAAVIQGTLAAITLLLAIGASAIPVYRPLAPLLLIGATGFALNLPHSFALQLLMRDLDYRRSRVGLVVSSLAGTVTTVALGIAGYGALAILAGAQVAGLMPLSLWLLLGRRWRPTGPWFAWPAWGRHGAALRFGAQQVSASLLQAIRGAVEASVLPGTIGFVPMGLLGRAQALHIHTTGRISGVLRDTVYPLLPRSAGDRATFARHTTLFAQATLLAAIPTAVGLGLMGPQLSRVLYGQKWVAADPLIWPAAMAGLGAVMVVAGLLVVQAASRLRAALALAAVEAGLAAPVALLTLAGVSVADYAWLVAAAELTAGLVALQVASAHFARRWAWAVLAAPVAAASAGAAAARFAQHELAATRPGAQLVLLIPAFGLAALLTLRLCFPRVLLDILTRLRGGAVLLRWLALRPSSA